MLTAIPTKTARLLLGMFFWDESQFLSYWLLVARAACPPCGHPSSCHNARVSHSVAHRAPLLGVVTRRGGQVGHRGDGQRRRGWQGDGGPQAADADELVTCNL